MTNKHTNNGDSGGECKHRWSMFPHWWGYRCWKCWGFKPPDMKIINPGDVRNIRPPIRLEHNQYIVDANDIIVASLTQTQPDKAQPS